MGHWGVKSYENDEAGDALDAGFARVHGATYEGLMDDSNPLTPEGVQERLAGPETLAAALEALDAEVGLPIDEWDEEARLAYAGIVVRHVELEVEIPAEVRVRTLAYLRDEPIEWEEVTARRLRRDREIRLLDPPFVNRSDQGSREMRARRTLTFDRIEAVMPEVDRLLRGHSTAGNWSLGQICGHLAGAIRGSVEGYGGKAPWPVRATIGRLFKSRVLKSGKMPEGARLPEKFVPKPGLDDRAEAEALRATIGYYLAHPEPRTPHPFFGRMTPAEWDRLHCIHAAHHLSFLLPA